MNNPGVSNIYLEKITIILRKPSINRKIQLLVYNHAAGNRHDTSIQYQCKELKMLTYYTASNVIQNKSNTDKISALIWLQKQGYIKQFNKILLSFS